LAARGARKMNGTVERVGDEGAEKRLRSRARWIYVESALAALILTVLSFFFASVLPEAARSSLDLSLEQAADFLIRHGYAVLFGWVLLEQLGLPIPAAPLLIAAGALARAGKMNLTFAVALAFIAVILADLFWYSLGRYRGGRILKLLCRISLEPDSCVRRTENVFIRHGVRSLLVAKFIPGLNTAAPSLAGVFRMPVRRFLIFDSLGGFFWVVTVTSLGLILSDQLERIALRWGVGWSRSWPEVWQLMSCGSSSSGGALFAGCGLRASLRKSSWTNSRPKKTFQSWTCASPWISRRFLRRSRVRFV
jgi:membrane protein DedA with SNARE-associated domain